MLIDCFKDKYFMLIDCFIDKYFMLIDLFKVGTILQSYPNLPYDLRIGIDNKN